jgi:hypothetical protein
LEPLPGGKDHYGRTTHNIRYRHNTRRIFRIEGVKEMIINPYSHNMKRSQYYDIYLNLIHEKHHAENSDHFIGAKVDENGNIEERAKNRSEYLAYKAVLEHHYFKYDNSRY